MENYNLGLGDPNNPVDIRPRNRKKNPGTRGLTISQISIIISYIFFFHLSLLSSAHSPFPSSPPRLSPCYKSIWYRVFPSLTGKQENILGDPEGTHYTSTTNYLCCQGKQISYKLTYANHHHHTPTFYSAYFLPVGV